MNAYSPDLRKKVVEAKQRGTPTSEVVRSFGVGVSTIKRYAAKAREGRSLDPKKRPGSRPKMDEAARRLLKADLRERPRATLPRRREFLGCVAGVSVSDSTVSRMLGGLGRSRKRSAGAGERDEFLRAAWRTLVVGAIDAARLVFVDEIGANVSLSPLYAWAQGRACSVQSAAQSGEERQAFGEHDLRRNGAVHSGGREHHRGGV
ncbi:MAG TPA: helix-turn-helix domain-containing protein [Rubrobacteraceae bacterium]|jgi:transposase|nr:helix-turn-helix domain-containing protein [Rubrobacteraceae bacterium]